MATELEKHIAAEEQRLQDVRKELAELGELSRKLRQAEKETEEKIFKLKQQRSYVEEQNMRTSVKTLQDQLVKHDQVLAELQASYERALDEKMRLHSEIQKISGQSTALAGAPRPASDANLRYELQATTGVRSGSSADPLAQAPVATVNPLQHIAAARGIRSEPLATTDTLGERPAGSPVVNPAEYIVDSSRPGTGERRGGRFSEWRPVSSRNRQPPGGVSSVGSILG